MRRFPYELVFALLAVLLVSAGYWLAAPSGLPQPGSLVGHGVGILGFLMMLSTETLYSLRKRLRGFHLGRMSTWLQVHIFTGIVGPYLVLLHTAGKFHGLAGVLTLLTVIMVISGFVGRYIYTAVPRTLDGTELGASDLEGRMLGMDQQLDALGLAHLQAAVQPLAILEPVRGWRLILGRSFLRRQQQRRLQRAIRSLNLPSRAEARELETLLQERQRVQMDVQSLAATRRLMALWHICHVPLGVALFTLAFIHIGAALYYATFLR